MPKAVENLIRPVHKLENENELVTPGRLARILNPFREQNPYRGTSYGFLILTNECDGGCDICYMDSRPGLIETRLNPTLVFGLIPEFQDIDEIILSGGEPTLHPSFGNILQAASQAAKMVTVFTNGSGFLDKSLLRGAGESPETIAFWVRKSMEQNLSMIPPNVEIAFPVTESHLQARSYHQQIIQVAATLAREWISRDDRSQIRFIVKNTPGKPGSGEELIQRFGIEGLGLTGARFPGPISGHGRAANITKEVDSMHKSTKFKGGIHIDYHGVFANEPSLLARFHFGEVTNGQICPINSDTTVEEIVQKVSEYLSKYGDP